MITKNRKMIAVWIGLVTGQRHDQHAGGAWRGRPRRLGKNEVEDEGQTGTERQCRGDRLGADRRSGHRLQPGFRKAQPCVLAEDSTREQEHENLRPDHLLMEEGRHGHRARQHCRAERPSADQHRRKRSRRHRDGWVACCR
jgi:hypothetical protein